MGEDDVWQEGPGEIRDPYAVLGVPREASTAEIIRAFRVLARGYHPDLHPGDPQAASRFRRLAAAYRMLTDPVRRAAWDRAHPAPAPAAEPEPARPAGQPPATGPPASAAYVVVRASSRRPGPPLRAGPVYHTPPGW